MLKRFELALLLGVIISVVLTSVSAFAQESAQIRGEVVRLHLLANSNSPGDQALKLKVRDAVLTARPEIFEGSYTRQQALELASEHLPEIKQIARDEISRQGYNYPVYAEIVNMYFATIRYEGFILPAGRYDAIRLVIGEGTGENWWCVMFPPMCIPAVKAPGGHPVEEQIARLGQTPRYQPKFAVVELVESIIERIHPQQ